MQSVNGSYIGMGWTPLTTAFLGTINFSTIKRANPTISVSATSDFQATTTGGTVALTSISFTSGLTFSRFDADVSSGFTVGYGAALRCANSTGFIAIDIEL
jgi:hypothetical protein